MFRNTHRWVMTAAGVVLLYWALSGLTLAIYDATDRSQEWADDGGGAGARTPAQIDGFVIAHATPLERADLATMTATALNAVDKVAPGARLDAIEISIVDGAHQAIATLAQASPRRLRVDGLTGAVLESGGTAERWMERGPSTLHTVLKNWHRGNVAGVAGLILALCAGTSLALLCVTGAVYYFQLWQRRRAARRPALLWKDGPSAATAKWTVRTLHRWVALFSLAYLLNMSVTGIVLAWSSLPQELHGASESSRASFTQSEIAPLLAHVYDSAHALSPASPIFAVRVRLLGGEPLGLVIYGGPAAGQLALRPESREYVVSLSGSRLANVHWDTHTLFKRLHRGDFIGSFSGRFLDIAAGLCLLFLLVSAGVMYVDMYRKRRRAGRRAPFWR